MPTSAALPCPKCGRAIRAKECPFCGYRRKVTVERNSPEKNRRFGRLWRERRELVLDRDGYTCQAVECGVTVAVRAVIDHVWPRARGGNDSLQNLKTTCPRCSAIKTAAEQRILDDDELAGWIVTFYGEAIDIEESRREDWTDDG